MIKGINYKGIINSGANGCRKYAHLWHGCVRALPFIEITACARPELRPELRCNQSPFEVNIMASMSVSNSTVLVNICHYVFLRSLRPCSFRHAASPLMLYVFVATI